MGVMDMFNNLMGNNSQPVAAQTPNGPAPEGNIPASAATNSATVSNATTAPNGTVPVVTADAMKSPLDQFNTLWETDPNAVTPPASMFASLDSRKVMETASKVDFTKVVSPELMQKINGGGEGAMQAMMEAMGKMSQMSFAQSALATTKIVEQALKEQETKYNSELPNHIKRQTVSNTLRDENPALSHPAAQPILEAIKTQMTAKYPNATASEVAGMAKDYLASFATAVSPVKVKDDTSDGKQGGTDFSSWDSF